MPEADATAWRGLCAALRSGSDAFHDGWLLTLCGVRVYDVRTGLSYAVSRMGYGFRKMHHVALKCLLFPLLVVLVPLWLLLQYASLVTRILQLLPMLPCLIAGQEACKLPLACLGTEARNAAHASRRAALLDDFAQAHGLVMSYECVRYTYYQGGSKSNNAWRSERLPALRVRLATPDGPPAGLLQQQPGDADAAMV